MNSAWGNDGRHRSLTEQVDNFVATRVDLCHGHGQRISYYPFPFRAVDRIGDQVPELWLFGDQGGVKRRILKQANIQTTWRHVLQAHARRREDHPGRRGSSPLLRRARPAELSSWILDDEASTADSQTDPVGAEEALILNDSTVTRFVALSVLAIGSPMTDTETLAIHLGGIRLAVATCGGLHNIRSATHRRDPCTICAQDSPTRCVIGTNDLDDPSRTSSFWFCVGH